MKKSLYFVLALVLLIYVPSCSGDGTQTTEPKNVDLSAVMQKINTECNIKNVEAIDDVKDLGNYYLILESSVKSYSAEIDKKGINEIVLVETVSEDAKKSVEEVLNQRLKSKISEAASYEADQLAIIKDCKVETNGNYVSMIVCEDADKATQIYKDAFK